MTASDTHLTKSYPLAMVLGVYFGRSDLAEPYATNALTDHLYRQRRPPNSEGEWLSEMQQSLVQQFRFLRHLPPPPAPLEANFLQDYVDESPHAYLDFCSCMLVALQKLGGLSQADAGAQLDAAVKPFLLDFATEGHSATLIDQFIARYCNPDYARGYQQILGYTLEAMQADFRSYVGQRQARHVMPWVQACEAAHGEFADVMPLPATRYRNLSGEEAARLSTSRTVETEALLSIIRHYRLPIAPEAIEAKWALPYGSATLDPARTHGYRFTGELTFPPTDIMVRQNEGGSPKALFDLAAKLEENGLGHVMPAAFEHRVTLDETGCCTLRLKPGGFPYSRHGLCTLAEALDRPRRELGL